MNTLNHSFMPDYAGLAKAAGRGKINPIIGGFPNDDAPAAAPAQPAAAKVGPDAYKAKGQKAAARAAPKLPVAPPQPQCHTAKRRILRNLLCG